MYDFAFSVPWGLTAIISGIVGLVRKSDNEYALPIVCGALFIGISVRSVKRFFRGQLSPDGVIVKLAVTCGLAFWAHQRYQKTMDPHPDWFMAAGGAFMILFYVWNLFFGPAPLDPPPPYNPPKKRS
ncbi:MAG: hypothetical protein J3K34DRAFT_446939 [Monoraphidium minutum]|nr:MAG: hypothetical protein J3K34DRAFT_446939 [Monoraphidium minutum]